MCEDSSYLDWKNSFKRIVSDMPLNSIDSKRDHSDLSDKEFKTFLEKWKKDNL